ncbi:unnamed protein product [Peniophora sp. CBMAI 1063]|nr:unnamed protein product [Peniophora sp. CBMAI 1063]
MLWFSSEKKATVAPAATTTRHLSRAESSVLAMPGAYPKTKRRAPSIKRESTFVGYTGPPLPFALSFRTVVANAAKSRAREIKQAKFTRLLFEERVKFLRALEWNESRPPNPQRAVAAAYQEEQAKAAASPEAKAEYELHWQELLEDTRRKKEALGWTHRKPRQLGAWTESYLSEKEMVEDLIDGVRLNDSIDGVPLDNSLDSFFKAAVDPSFDDPERAERYAERERECAKALREHNEMLEDQERQKYLQTQREAAAFEQHPMLEDDRTGEEELTSNISRRIPEAEEKQLELEGGQYWKRRLSQALDRVVARRAAEEPVAADAANANAEAFARAAEIVKKSYDADEVAGALYDMSLCLNNEPDPVLRQYAVYEWRWAMLEANAVIDVTWDADSLPWPFLQDDIRLLGSMEEDGFAERFEAAIASFVLNDARRGLEGMSSRQRIRRELLHWNPDNFIASHLCVAPMHQREIIVKAVRLVASTLTGLLAKSSLQ